MMTQAEQVSSEWKAEGFIPMRLTISRYESTLRPVSVVVKLADFDPNDQESRIQAIRDLFCEDSLKAFERLFVDCGDWPISIPKNRAARRRGSK